MEGTPAFCRVSSRINRFGFISRETPERDRPTEGLILMWLCEILINFLELNQFLFYLLR